MNNRVDLEKLWRAANHFEKQAQQVSADYSLVDKIRKVYGPKITADASVFLNSRAVSSIPIRISWNKPKAEFLVDATGSDAEAVNQELKALLDKKYAASIGVMLSKIPETNFEFGLLTVE